MTRTTLPLFLGLGLAAALVVPASAQGVPDTMSFAGRLADADGPVDGEVDLDFEIFDAESEGSSVWSETHAGVTAADGVVYLTLGGMTPLDDSVFVGSALYLEITVNGDVMSPRLPIQAVPYATRAGVAEAVAPDAVTSDGLSPGSVTAESLAPEARGALGSFDLGGGSTSSTSPATIVEFQVDAPAAGVLQVTVTGQYYINVDSTTTSNPTAAGAQGNLGLCDQGNSSNTCGGTYTTLWYEDPDSNGTFAGSPLICLSPGCNHTEAFTLTRTVTVAGPGNRSFFLNGRAPTTNDAISVSDTNVHAVFSQQSLAISTP